MNPTATGAGEVHVSYCQLLVMDPHAFDHQEESLHDACRTGLAGTAPGGVTVLTGIHTGVVDVSVEVYDAAPPVELFGWEDVVEVSVHTASGTMNIAGLLGESLEGQPDITPAGAGDYRVRVHAAGRDIGPHTVPDDPFETYLFAVWPAPPGQTIVHLMTSRCGRDTVERARRAGGSE